MSDAQTGGTVESEDWVPDIEDSCPECGAGPDEWCDESCQCVSCDPQSGRGVES